MICPVCKNIINDNSQSCPICCFKDFQTEFINKDEANNWIQNTVKSHRKKWEYGIDTSYLKQSIRYPDFIRLRMKVKNNPTDYQSITELIGLLYGMIFNPTDKNRIINLRKSGIEELIKLCKHYITQVNFLVNNYEKSIIKMRIIYLSALLALIEGDIISAYNSFISIAKLAEEHCKKNDENIGPILSLFVYSEINIHQILTIFGVPDENFFNNEYEELSFFGKKNMPIEFTNTLGYIISTFTPVYHKYRNPFADMHPDAVAHNMRTLHMYVSNTELNITIRCIGNKEFVVNSNECVWKFKRSIVAEEIRQYLEDNKYEKIRGKIHNIIGFANATQ